MCIRDSLRTLILPDIIRTAGVFQEFLFWRPVIFQENIEQLLDRFEEIKEYIKNEEEEDREVGMVIFDDELSAKDVYKRQLSAVVCCHHYCYSFSF